MLCLVLGDDIVDLHQLFHLLCLFSLYLIIYLWCGIVNCLFLLVVNDIFDASEDSVIFTFLFHSKICADSSYLPSFYDAGFQRGFHG